MKKITLLGMLAIMCFSAVSCGTEVGAASINDSIADNSASSPENCCGSAVEYTEEIFTKADIENAEKSTYYNAPSCCTPESSVTVYEAVPGGCCGN